MKKSLLPFYDTSHGIFVHIHENSVVGVFVGIYSWLDNREHLFKSPDDASYISKYTQQ